MSATCKWGSDISFICPSIHPHSIYSDHCGQALEDTVMNESLACHRWLFTICLWPSFPAGSPTGYPAVSNIRAFVCVLSLTWTASSPSKLLPHSSGQTPAPVKTSHDLLYPAHREHWLALCVYTYSTSCIQTVKFCVEQRKGTPGFEP